MSVLKNNRNIAYTEFERVFFELYNRSANNTSKVAKRRKKWISDNIDYIMNQTSYLIMSINTMYYDKKSKNEEISKLANRAYSTLKKLQKPLLVFWNVEMYEFNKMASWANLIHKTLIEINKRSLNKIEESKVDNFMILDWNFINKTEFCRNICELHRYCHGKIANADCRYDSSYGCQLIELVDSAFYHVMEANRKEPKTKDEYDKRKEHISIAISELKDMERPMLFYINLMQYSERIIKEWSKMLNKEIKLLCGVQKSDKERFSKLK